MWRHWRYAVAVALWLLTAGAAVWLALTLTETKGADVADWKNARTLTRQLATDFLSYPSLRFQADVSEGVGAATNSPYVGTYVNVYDGSNLLDTTTLGGMVFNCYDGDPENPGTVSFLDHVNPNYKYVNLPAFGAWSVYTGPRLQWLYTPDEMMIRLGSGFSINPRGLPNPVAGEGTAVHVMFRHTAFTPADPARYDYETGDMNQCEILYYQKSWLSVDLSASPPYLMYRKSLATFEALRDGGSNLWTCPQGVWIAL